MLAVSRDHVLHVHLAHGDGPVLHLLALDADPEAALIGELERGGFRVGMRVRGRGDRGGGGGRIFDGGLHPLQDGLERLAIVAAHHGHGPAGDIEEGNV